ncbi:AsnC family transcriptional regulator [Natrinema salsiterrestre]|uniref:AsnC family transcriptional regulator n=1 Tax=Natrinema salsiterrestre TaxID=2950540 RepID=A0A9Q4Q1J7_9EURY|nr:AsnC family transcriptional regulator [Natrinema salsiterrestre]MDF9748110.1 AsnC family transcriptional regulator [Natrinema salsiterrestre]
MRDLDETDMEILSLLAEDARRPFSSIGEEVDLSGPAVSDRVKRLEEADIINGFTVDVNRAQLRAGVPVFVQLENDTAAIESLRSRLHDADGIEHLFVTAEGKIWFYGRAEGQNVRRWVEGLLEDAPSTEYSVTLVDDLEWTPSLDRTEFAITCAECGNTVDSEGESARIDGDIYHFCCPSCRGRFEDQYQRLEDGV